MPSTRAATSLSWIAGKRASGRAVDQVERERGADQEACRRDPVPGLAPRTGQPNRHEPRHRHAVRAAGPARLVGEDDGEEQSEAQRGDREIVPLSRRIGRHHEGHRAESAAPMMKDSHDGTPRWVGPIATA